MIPSETKAASAAPAACRGRGRRGTLYRTRFRPSAASERSTVSHRRAIRCLRSICRSGLALATLAGLAIGTIGFPIAPPGLSGVAFPCQGSSCGCRTAGDCWLGCCCLTPAQRLAWAKANDVTPPPELERLVADDEPPPTKSVASCCAGRVKRSCCAHGETAGCCKKSTTKRVARTATKSDSSTPTFSPRRCRGLGHWWVAGGQPLALPDRLAALLEPSGSEPVLILAAPYSLDADSPPARPG